MVRFLSGAGNFSLHHRVQNGSGAHPASYLMGTGGSFPGGKAAQFYKSVFNMRIWGFHGDEDSNRGLLGCDAVYWY
jgi:hypothetical protein